jgi:hypothetical protein
MAARESTIELIGLGAISARINIKIVSLGNQHENPTIKSAGLGAMATDGPARESNH